MLGGVLLGAPAAQGADPPAVDSVLSIQTVAGTGVAGFSPNGVAAASARLDGPAGVAVDTAGNVFVSEDNRNRVRRIDAVTGIITTVAGTGVMGYNGDGIPATAAHLFNPRGLAIGPDGDLYIADRGNKRIRRVDLTTDVITTVAGASGNGGYNGDGIPAVDAQLGNPLGVDVDGAGNVFIADPSHARIRKVDTAGIITTVAGNGQTGSSSFWGPATESRLNNPVDVAVDGLGGFFIVDNGSHQIRKVNYLGIIFTYAGVKGQAGYNGDGPATSGLLDRPTSVAVDGATVYIGDSHNHRVRVVSPSGQMTTLAGTGSAGYNGDTRPPGTAQVVEPWALDVAADGSVLVADDEGHRVRRVHSVQAGAIDGTLTSDEGAASGVHVAAYLRHAPWQIRAWTITDADGHFRFDGVIPASYRLRVVDTHGRFQSGWFDGVLTQNRGDPVPVVGGVTTERSAVLHDKASGALSGRVTTSATADPAPGIRVGVFNGDGYVAGAITGPLGYFHVSGLPPDDYFLWFSHPDLVFPSEWYRDADFGIRTPVPVAEGVRHVFAHLGTTAEAGTIRTVAGTFTAGYNGDDQPATSAELWYPSDVAVGLGGEVFIAEWQGNRVRRVDPVTGMISTVGGNGALSYARDGVPADQTPIGQVSGVVVDSNGNVFVASTNQRRIRRIDRVSGLISTVVGTGASGYNGDGIAATSASLDAPVDVVVDAAGNLFIADSGNNRIRRVDAVTGLISTVAGTGIGAFSGDGGPATAADITVSELALDAEGNLYFADGERIRRVDAATGTISTVAGTGVRGFDPDGTPATDARLYAPSGLVLDDSGNLYVADRGNSRVRRVDADTQQIVTVAGTGVSGYNGDNLPALAAQLTGPRGLALDDDGNLFLTEYFNDGPVHLSHRVRSVAAPIPP